MKCRETIIYGIQGSISQRGYELIIQISIN